MGLGEIVLFVSEAIALVKEIIELINLLKENEDTINEALKNLKQLCEGALVDALETVVNVFLQACESLIIDFTSLMQKMISNMEAIEKADKEGAQLLKDALSK